MSNLSISLSAAKTVVLKPAETQTLDGDVIIDKIVDMPSLSSVSVTVRDLGVIQPADLNGDNYDSPAEWTNASVKAAVLKHIYDNS